MKKLLFILILAAFISCKKDGITPIYEPNYCASCTEMNTGYQADDFCGSEISVDYYIQQMYLMGAAAGQNWHCIKRVE